MSAKVEFLNVGSNDESADCLSPWQVAKRIAGEFTGSHSEFRSFADDSCIEAWLEAEV